MRRSQIAAATTLMVLALGTAIARLEAQTPNALAGTWTLDVAKSKYSPGPAPKTLTLMIEDTADGMKTASDVVMADGQTYRTTYTAKVDGKDYPLVGSPFADTVALETKGNNRLRTDKKSGKVVMRYDGVLSADGKTFTVDQKGTGAKGEPVHNTLVLVKKM